MRNPERAQLEDPALRPALPLVLAFHPFSRSFASAAASAGSSFGSSLPLDFSVYKDRIATGLQIKYQNIPFASLSL